MSRTKDTELHDIDRILAILQQLHPSARERVMRYISDRIHLLAPPPNGHAHQGDGLDDVLQLPLTAEADT